MQTIIFDPAGGASGDMILAALIDLGCPPEYLRENLGRLDLQGWKMVTAKRTVHGITCGKVNFEVPTEHSHRTYAAIKDLIEKAGLSQGITNRALAIFERIAAAEAKVHGIAPEEVHFHEVGAMDSILDIVGIAAAIDYLNPATIYSRPVPLGTGTTRSRHGIIPLPAPATVEILKDVPVRFTDIKAELTTPTGAAVIAALSRGLPPAGITLKACTYGAGDRELEDWPNLFRAITAEQTTSEKIYVVETDIDDMFPEDWEALTERLSGIALDTSLTARTMKNGRPATGLKALVNQARLDEATAAILQYSSAIGVRYYTVERRVLERRSSQIQTSLGPVNVKTVTTPDGRRRSKPEYRDIHRLAAEHNLSPAEVRNIINSQLPGEPENG